MTTTTNTRSPAGYTPEQEAAIQADGEETLLLACPGSGKSTTLVERIVRRHSEDASKVIVSTFTQRAARELRGKLANRGIQPYYVGTDHGLCLRIMRMVDERWTVMDEQSAIALIDEIRTRLRCKVTTASVLKAMAEGRSDAKMQAVILEYRAAMRRNFVADYDHLLAFGAKAASIIGAGWHLYVDEYQDTTTNQELLYNSINCESRFFVGDPDQTIYSWRGSKIENILIRQDVADRYTLTRNFRSSRMVVDCANNLIQRNSDRGKAPAMHTEIEGGRVEVQQHTHEAEEIGSAIAWWKETPGTKAILTRYNAEKKTLIKAFEGHGIAVPKRDTLNSATTNRLTSLMAIIDQPDNEIFRGQYFRAWYDAKEAQERIERREQVYVPKPQRWDDWATLLNQRRVGAGSIAHLWAVHQRAGGTVDAGELRVAWITNQNEEEDPLERGPVILTMHGAKGLEFEHVRIFAADHDGRELSQEERRLFYVAVTRAKETVTITWSFNRTNPWTHQTERRQPVQFTRELWT